MYAYKLFTYDLYSYIYVINRHFELKNVAEKKHFSFEFPNVDIEAIVCIVTLRLKQIKSKICYSKFYYSKKFFPKFIIVFLSTPKEKC